MNKQDIQTVLDALGMAVDCIDDQYQRNTYTRIIAAIAILQAALAEPEPFTPDWVSYRQGVADGKEALAEPSEADDTSCPTCGEDAMHMLGNAVVPMVACDVINALRAAA